MASDREYGGGQVRLSGFGASDYADQENPGRRLEPDRRDGIRHVRQVSNWTAAALIVGAAGATVALAHQALPATVPATGAASPAGTAAASHGTAGATGPQATHSVATTSGSGVTVTTTTHTAGGKTIVTHVRHMIAYHDN